MQWEEHTKLMTKRVCVVCGKEFEVHTCDLKHRPCLCCSIECGGKHRSKTHVSEKHHKWTGGKVERTCKVCGKKFYVKKSQIEWSGAKYCSQNCSSIYNVRHQQNKYDTDIEIIMKESLIKENINFEPQAMIKGITTSDFLLDNKIIVECDGDYWHTLPKQKIRDKKVNKSLKDAGYIVLRFWGSDIKEDISNCITIIKETITKSL